MTTMTRQELHSGDQYVYFDGTLLGRASSEYTSGGFHKPRWTEISIYRTTDDRYVITKIGKSRIVHASQSCRALKNNEDRLRKVDLDEGDYEFCDPNYTDAQQCWTDDSLNRASYGYLENDHATLNFADNPQGAVSACYSRDPLGVFSISWLARKALDQAFENDEDLADAYQNFDISLLGRRTTR